MTEPFEYEPGSLSAIAWGCTCPAQAGPGVTRTADGRPGYLCDQHCPMHGLEAVKQELAAREARIIRDAENDNEPTA